MLFWCNLVLYYRTIFWLADFKHDKRAWSIVKSKFITDLNKTPTGEEFTTHCLAADLLQQADIRMPLHRLKLPD